MVQFFDSRGSMDVLSIEYGGKTILHLSEGQDARYDPKTIHNTTVN